jgi:chromosome partitioning protein
VQWVFLDLPGRSAPIASAGLAAADIIIIPCRPHDVDIEASVPTVQAARRANKSYAYLMSIIAPQQDKKRAQQVAGTLKALGHMVLPDFIIQRVGVPDAIAIGSSAVEEQPSGESAKEFKKLLEWIRRETKS